MVPWVAGDAQAAGMKGSRKPPEAVRAHRPDGASAEKEIRMGSARNAPNPKGRNGSATSATTIVPPVVAAAAAAAAARPPRRPRIGKSRPVLRQLPAGSIALAVREVTPPFEMPVIPAVTFPDRVID